MIPSLHLILPSVCVGFSLLPARESWMASTHGLVPKCLPGVTVALLKSPCVLGVGLKLGRWVQLAIS